MTDPTREPTREAAEFPVGYQWFNTDHPLVLREDLAGHVVILYFWTSSSINCLHVLPTLAFLEQQFVDQSLVTIGVHTGKFPAEHQPDHVAAAVQQHGIRHPVLVDRDMVIWQAYGVRSWPTLVLIDAHGKIRFQGVGEPDRDRLAAAVATLLDEASALVSVNSTAAIDALVRGKPVITLGETFYRGTGLTHDVGYFFNAHKAFAEAILDSNAGNRRETLVRVLSRLIQETHPGPGIQEARQEEDYHRCIAEGLAIRIDRIAKLSPSGMSVD